MSTSALYIPYTRKGLIITDVTDLPLWIAKNETRVKLIKPSEISASILTLLDESDEKVIIVSPYMKISKWYKFINKVNELKTRNIIIEIYVRDDPENKATYRDLDRLELEYKKIPHL